MKNLRNEKGITLVALVVTIIVLLILAGVSLSLVAGGNGIIDKAVTASDETISGSAEEQVQLKLAELVADYYEEKYVDGTLSASITTKKAYIASKLSTATDIGNYNMTVTEAGAVTVTDKNSNQVGTGTIDDNGKLTGWTFNRVTGTTPATPSMPE